MVMASSPTLARHPDEYSKIMIDQERIGKSAG